MKLLSLTCPKCGADLEIEEGRKDCYCNFCGHHIYVDEGVKEVIYRQIDEARIKEAEVDLIKSNKNDKYELIKIVFISLAIIAICILLYFKLDSDEIGALAFTIIVGATIIAVRYFKGKFHIDD